MQGPGRFIIRIVLFLCVVAALGVALYGTLQQAFLHNAMLNGVIVATLVFGILFALRQTVRLGPEVEWMRKIDETGRTRSMPNLLRPVATMAHGRDGVPQLSPVALRSVLDGVAARLDESRELSRYLISLLIFLGLLGTFWGLIKTVGSVSDVIGSLDFSGNGAAQSFTALKQGLMAPLSGMGTAFSASLFGLMGSLILGFLDLQLGQAQTAFFRDLEDWLSGIGRSNGETPYLEASEQQQPPTHYLQALVEQTAENLDQLRQVVTATDSREVKVAQNLFLLVERMDNMANVQADLKQLIQRLTELLTRPALNPEEAMQSHLRAIETTLAHMAGDLAQGRKDLTNDLRAELKLIARTIGTVRQTADTSFGVHRLPPEG